MKSRQRYFLGPSDVAGLMSSLNSGLRQNGASAIFFDLGTDVFQYRERERYPAILQFYVLARRWFAGTRRMSRWNPARILVTAILLGSMWGSVLFVAIWAKVIVLKSGEGISGTLLELKLYRALSKTVIFVYAGSDSRPPYMVGYWSVAIEHVRNGGARNAIRADVLTIEELAERTRRIRAHLDLVDPFATYILDNPLAGHFHSRPCVTFQCVGLSVDVDRIRRAGLDGFRERRKADVIRIFHAPSLPEVKGSLIFRGIVERLQAKGFPIDYVEMSGIPNQEVLRQIAQSDIVFDELYSDTYGATLAIESATLGVPVVTGGYGLAELHRTIPAALSLPIVYVHPDNIEAAVERLVADHEYRTHVGERLRNFVVSNATPILAAKRLMRIAEGRAPDDWYFDPRAINYFAGVGGSQERVCDNVQRLVALGGPGALGLDDRASLRNGFLALKEGHSQTEIKRTVARL